MFYDDQLTWMFYDDHNVISVANVVRWFYGKKHEHIMGMDDICRLYSPLISHISKSFETDI